MSRRIDLIGRRGINGDYKYNGIDRLDSDKEYSIFNCVPCCSRCNLLKMDINYNDFLLQIKKIYEFRNLK